MKRLIVYDLDGTLADTLDDIAASVTHTLQQLQAPPISHDEVRRAVGHGVRELITRCLKQDDAPRIERGMTLFLAHYAEHLLDRTRLYPGAREVLEHFRTRRQAVITNKPTTFSRQILDRLGVAGYFVEILGSDAGYPKKPDPRAVLALMRRVDVTPPDTLLIGDSPIDVETARNAGITVVCVTHGLGDARELATASPDGLAEDFAELLAQAQQAGW